MCKTFFHSLTKTKSLFASGRSCSSVLDGTQNALVWIGYGVSCAKSRKWQLSRKTCWQGKLRSPPNIEVLATVKSCKPSLPSPRHSSSLVIFNAWIILLVSTLFLQKLGWFPRKASSFPTTRSDWNWELSSLFIFYFYFLLFFLFLFIYFFARDANLLVVTSECIIVKSWYHWKSVLPQNFVSDWVSGCRTAILHSAFGIWDVQVVLCLWSWEAFLLSEQHQRAWCPASHPQKMVFSKIAIVRATDKILVRIWVVVVWSILCSLFFFHRMSCWVKWILKFRVGLTGWITSWRILLLSEKSCR